MTFKTSVQGFITAHTANNSAIACVDWVRKNVYIVGEFEAQLSRFSIVTGGELQSVALSTFGTEIVAQPIGMDPQAQLYMTQPGGNNGGLLQLNGPTLGYVGQWGTGSAFSNLPDGIPESGDITCINGPGFEFTLCQGLGGISSHTYSVMTNNVFAGVNLAWQSGTDYSVGCPGKPGSGTFYMLQGPGSSGDTQLLNLVSVVCAPSLWVPADWPGQNGGIVSTLIGTIGPTAIDGAWTQIYARGHFCDQTDGNIIARLQGQSGAANQCYIVKIKASDASIMWKVPFAGMVDAGQMMKYSRCLRGQFSYYQQASPATVYIIDTADGSFTSYTTGLSGLGGTGQCYDDTSGAIIMQGSYTNEGSDSPIPLNGTPNFSNQWMALYVTMAIPPPFVPGGRVTRTAIWGNQLQ